MLVRGIPVERYGEDDAARVYFGLGLHIGRPVSQNAQGDLLGHVLDEGLPGTNQPGVRFYRTRQRQEFHTDGADVIGLLCLRTAKSGGTSRIASSLAIFDEIRRRRPDLIDALDLIESIANDPAFHLDMAFEPGDLQWLNNAAILHSREAYEDWLEPERKRHLLRLSLSAHDFASVDDQLRSGLPAKAG